MMLHQWKEVAMCEPETENSMHFIPNWRQNNEKITQEEFQIIKQASGSQRNDKILQKIKVEYRKSQAADHEQSIEILW